MLVLRLGLFAGLVASCKGPNVGTIADARRPLLPGMIRVQAGTLERGRDDAERPDERPRHQVQVAHFAIDETLVTRAAFARFVSETGWVTLAERAGFGMGAWEGLDDWEWQRMPGASWRHPFPDGTPDADAFLRDDAPVVLVNWFDAVAFCRHYRKRLPTEAEWEYAMGSGARGTRYPWGDEAERDGKIALNFWQGASHRRNTRLDGWLYVSPVRAFPPNAWGIFDAVGNVWQWTDDVYDPETYAKAAHGVSSSGHAEDAGGAPKPTLRVLRGGSWWCGPCTCEGYGLWYRGKADPNAAYNNNGFRCAKDIP